MKPVAESRDGDGGNNGRADAPANAQTEHEMSIYMRRSLALHRISAGIEGHIGRKRAPLGHRGTKSGRRERQKSIQHHESCSWRADVCRYNYQMFCLCQKPVPELLDGYCRSWLHPSAQNSFTQDWFLLGVWNHILPSTICYS